MTCQEFLITVDPYLDDELTVLETLRTQGHLIFCEPCRKVLESEAFLRSLVTADGLRDEPPPGLRERVLQRLPAVRSVSHRFRPAFPRAGVRGAVLLGTVTLGLVLGVLTIPGLRGPRDLPALAGEVAAKHLLYSDGTSAALEMTTSEPTRMALWLEPRLGFSVKLPSLARPGERLLGGRVSSVADAPAAYLLYERGGGRISLFVMRPPAGAPPGGAKHMVEGVELYTTTLRGISVVWWEDAERLYALASGTALSELLEFALLCVRSASPSGAGGQPSPEQRTPTLSRRGGDSS